MVERCGASADEAGVLVVAAACVVDVASGRDVEVVGVGGGVSVVVGWIVVVEVGFVGDVDAVEATVSDEALADSVAIAATNTTAAANPAIVEVLDFFIGI